MSRTQKFFRYVWRINAVLILVAAAGAAFGVVYYVVDVTSSNIRQSQVAAAAPPVAGNAERKELRLGKLALIEGTTIYRAPLFSRGEGAELSSKYDSSSEVRNILFMNLETGRARWLLPSVNEIVTFNEDVPAPFRDGASTRPLAIVILVKPYSSDSETAAGRLLLLDVAAEHVNQVAANVRDVHGVTLTPSGEIAILFERDHKYQLASFDRASLAKLSERTINVPALK